MPRQGAAAPAAYESYYGLAEAPFSLSPGVRFAFQSRAYTSALDEVRRALDRREGFIVITGEIGTGKTMLCRTVMQESDAKTFVSLVLDPCVTAEEMLAQVLTDFGVLGRDERMSRSLAPRHHLLIVLQRFLASLAPLGGRAVVIIDEAQHLHPAVLEQIRLWSNFEGEGARLLQIVFAGQPELDHLLNRPDMRQVQQRVSRRCELTRLRRDEVAHYLEHRLTVARGAVDEGGGGGRPAGVLSQGEFWRVRFTPRAARAVAALTRGIPRLVNLLADRALEVGCERQARTIDARLVRVAARRLNLLAPGLPRVAPRVAAAAAAVLVLGASWGWHATAQWAVGAAGGDVVAAAAPTSGTAPPPALAAPSTGFAGESRTLDVQDSVTVSIASFRTEQRAASVTAQLVDAGFPAFTRRHPGGVWHQVIVGPYVSKEEADAAQQALQAHGVTGTDVRLDSVVAGDAVATGGRP